MLYGERTREKGKNILSEWNFMTNQPAFLIRPLFSTEYSLLEDFLYEAIYQPEGEPKLAREVIYRPEIFLYIDDFGRPGDRCLAAEVDGQVVGAVWVRIFSSEQKGYGTLDDQTPELSISLKQGYRGQRIGSALLRAMLTLLRSECVARVSLSVQKENPAARLYRSLGFEIVEELHDEYIMLKSLARD
jgi:ribosomal protein S18 acetylase RimI-like enzyme